MAKRKKGLSRPTEPHGPLIHPETGEKAPDGKCWVRNIMSGTYVLEAIGTPWCCSVASETYWCS